MAVAAATTSPARLGRLQSSHMQRTVPCWASSTACRHRSVERLTAPATLVDSASAATRALEDRENAAEHALIRGGSTVRGDLAH